MPVTCFDVARSLHNCPVILAAICTLLLASCEPRPSAGGPQASVRTTQANAEGSSEFITALTLEGDRVPIFAIPNSRATVLLFLATECPISNRYAPELRRLEEKFGALGIRFWRVYPEGDASLETIRSHLQAHGYPPEALRDPKHELVRLSGVRVTPEAAVFLPGGQLVYHGRIDDRYVAFGRQRPTPTQRDLEVTLEAILQKQPIPSAHQPAIGCYLSESK